MKINVKWCSCLLWACLAAVPCVRSVAGDSLQWKHWCGAVSVLPGRVLVMDRYQGMWQKGKSNMAAGVEVGYTPLPADSDAFARDYDYPTVSLGLRYHWNHGVTMHRSQEYVGGTFQEADYDSRMGNAVSLYGTFSRPFFRNRHWTADYSLSFGTTYSPRKYNKENNVDNVLIGSRWLIYFGAGLHLAWHMADNWGLRAGLDYYHHSNGALNRPNKGANFVAPSLGVVYMPYYDEVTDGKKRMPNRVFKPYWYWNLTAAAGAKTMEEDWKKTQYRTQAGQTDYRTEHFKLYAAYAFSADVMCRYRRRWASGLGVDVFYGTYASHVKQMDEEDGYDVKHSPWSVGIAAKHEVFWHQFSLSMALGVYVYRHMGRLADTLEKPYYERVGLHYTFRRLGGLQLGVNVKAHYLKADYTEVSLGWPIRL